MRFLAFTSASSRNPLLTPFTKQPIFFCRLKALTMDPQSYSKIGICYCFFTLRASYPAVPLPESSSPGQEQPDHGSTPSKIRFNPHDRLNLSLSTIPAELSRCNAPATPQHQEHHLHFTIPFLSTMYRFP